MTDISTNLGLSQNFLHNKMILQYIVNIIDIENREVVEIGPGTGNLTKCLLLKKYKTLTLYEIDNRLIHILKNEIQNENVDIINANCLNININTDVIISNLPYSISTPFCKNLLLKYTWNECVLLIQKEFCEKICDIYNPLGLLFNMTCDIKKMRDVSHNHFIPKPKVMSSIVYIKKRIHTYNMDHLWLFAIKLFSYSRKKLPMQYAPYNSYRPAQLSINQIIELYEKSR